jgi:hypothetical protein
LLQGPPWGIWIGKRKAFGLPAPAGVVSTTDVEGNEETISNTFRTIAIHLKDVDRDVESHIKIKMMYEEEGSRND